MNGNKVFLDTCILIYLFEETAFSKQTEEIFFKYFLE